MGDGVVLHSNSDLCALVCGKRYAVVFRQVFSLARYPSKVICALLLSPFFLYLEYTKKLFNSFHPRGQMMMLSTYLNQIFGLKLELLNVFSSKKS